MHSRFFFLFFFCCLATTTRCNVMCAHVAPALKLLSLSPMHPSASTALPPRQRPSRLQRPARVGGSRQAGVCGGPTR